MQDVQEEVKKNKLTANLRTYGILAMTCRSEKDGQQLLKDMEVGTFRALPTIALFLCFLVNLFFFLLIL